MLPIGSLTQPSSVAFQYHAFTQLEYREDLPIIIPVFEEQADLIVDKPFPEVKALREHMDALTNRRDDIMVAVFPVKRGDVLVTLCVVYVGQKFKSSKSSRLKFGSISFYRTLSVRMTAAIARLREMKFVEATIILPGRFFPDHLKKDPRQEREEEIFVRTVATAVVVANDTFDAYFASPEPRMSNIYLTHFGEMQSQKTVPHFFNRAIGSGVLMGESVGEARRLTQLPPNDKTPLSLAEHFLGTEIKFNTPSTKKVWKGIRGHRFGSQVKASIIYGTKALEGAGFRMIAAIGRGSQHEPCFLSLHYRPKNKKENTKKLALIGKGVVFDTGGTNLKESSTLKRMHYDMAGAATAVAVLRYAVAKRLQVEIVVLIPLVDNAIGSKSIRPGEILRAYGGQTNEITDTDSEGRVILADAISFSEKHMKPDCTITIATLTDMAEFGPAIIKVIGTDDDLKRKAEQAMQRSHEVMFMLPKPEDLGDVTSQHVGDLSDLKNDIGTHYHTSPAMAMYDYFPWSNSRWMHIDVAAVFEDDADDYGSGPGFGVRFLAEMVKQFAYKHS